MSADFFVVFLDAVHQPPLTGGTQWVIESPLSDLISYFRIKLPFTRYVRAVP